MLIFIGASFLITMIGYKLQKPASVEDHSKQLFEESLGNINQGDRIFGVVEDSREIYKNARQGRKARSGMKIKTGEVFYIKIKDDLNKEVYVAVEPEYPSPDNEMLSNKLKDKSNAEFEVTKDYEIKVVPQT
jgi:hypothetical protein